jgi:hypothetical protein
MKKQRLRDQTLEELGRGGKRETQNMRSQELHIRGRVLHANLL